MTAEECQRVLREMEATWPRSDRTTWTEQEVAVWLKTLAPLEIADARAALDACRETSKWLPAHAEFTACAKSSKHRREDYLRAQERRATFELGPVSTPAEEDAARALDHIAGIGRPRDSVASAAYSAVWSEHLRKSMDQIGRNV